MSKENGFVPLRRGLWEHIRDGRMSHLEALAFVYICSQADTRTGVWKGSAGALVGELAMKPRTARDVLEKLEHGDYIRRFLRPGERFCYPILVHKFLLTQGEHVGEVIDALSSTFSNDCLDLVYFSREVSVEVHGEVDVEVSASQRRQETREKRKEKKAKTDHPKKRDDAVFPPKSFSEKATQILLEKYPEDGEEKICFGLQVISERAYNSRSNPRSEAYFITAYESLREEERFGEEFEWYRENPQSNDSRNAVNALIRKAERESRRSGREFLDCFHDLRQNPNAFGPTPPHKLEIRESE